MNIYSINLQRFMNIIDKFIKLVGKKLVLHSFYTLLECK